MYVSFYMSMNLNLELDLKYESIPEKLENLNQQLQEGPKRTVNWFNESMQRSIVRHPSNMRKVGGMMHQYKEKIFASGIVEGVRGEAWLVRGDTDPESNSGSKFYALTFGTLCLVLG